MEIVVTSTDRSEAGLASADAKVEALRKSAIQKIEDINAREIRLKADITQAELKLADLRRKAESAAGDAKVKVDADIASAEAKLQELRRQLAAIPDAKAKVDLDTADAIRKINEVKSKADDSFRQRAFSITADTSGAIAGVGALIAILASVGPAVVAAAGALAGLGAGVGVGAGAAIAGFTGIGDAMDAMGQKATGGGGAVAASASQIRSATQSVVDARRNLEQATEDVSLAEEDLTAAQEDAQRVQEGLNDARQDAIRMLEDYQLRSEDMALSQRSAALSVQEAEQRLSELRKDGKADALDLARAELNVEEARQRQKQLAVDSTRLAQDKAVADAKGVEGSNQVVAANDRIVAASNRVAEADRALRGAKLDQVRATEQLAISQLRLQEAMKPQGGGGTAVDKLDEAMSKLGPNARDFARFLKGFVDNDLAALRKAGQEEFLPGVQDGLQELRPMMREITPAWAEFSQVTGEALGGLIPLLGRLAPSVLEFASVSLQGMSPLGGVITEFTDRFSAMVDRVTASGDATESMHQLVAIIGQVINVVPALIEYGMQLMAVMGPDLQASFSNVGQAAGELGDAFLEFAPTAGDLLVAVTGLLPPLAEFLGWLINLDPHITATAIAVAAGAAAFLKLRSAAIITKTVLTDLGASFGIVRRGADDVDASAGRATAALGRVGAGLLAAQAASAAFGASASVGATTAAKALEEYARTGEESSEVLKHLGYDLDTLADSHWYDKAAIGTAKVIEGFTGLGSVMDNSLQHAGERFASLDAALAQMASSGQAAAAAQAFERIAQQADEQGISLDRLKRAFPQYTEALAEAGNAAESTASQTDRLRDAQSRLAEGTLSLGRAENQYFEQLDRTRQAIAANGHTVDVHTAKGRANRQALFDQADAARRLLQQIQENEGESPRFVQTQEQMRQALIKAARQAGASKEDIAKLSDAIRNVPPGKTVNFQANVAGALGAIRSVTTAIDNVRDKTVTIRTVTTNSDGSVSVRSGKALSAGGRIPGAPSRVDTVPAMLAPGEFVVNSQSTAQWLPLLEQINSGAPLTVQTLRSAGLPMPAGEAGPAAAGGAVTVVLQIQPGGSEIDGLFIEWLRRAIRTRGGDVQIVLGQGEAA